MTQVLFGPSEKQVAFLKSLLAQREVDADIAEQHLANIPTMDKRTASNLIDSLLRLPIRARVVDTPMQHALAEIPKSKYAVSVDDLELAPLSDTPLTGDLLFLEVREYMGNLYMRRLTGAVGGFTRHRMPAEDVLLVTALIKKDPYKFARLFGKHYSCCGSCGAELTDPTSRELQLGPECRKKFGK